MYLSICPGSDHLQSPHCSLIQLHPHTHPHTHTHTRTLAHRHTSHTPTPLQLCGAGALVFHEFSWHSHLIFKPMLIDYLLLSFHSLSCTHPPPASSNFHF